jgi:hypothetical protein
LSKKKIKTFALVLILFLAVSAPAQRRFSLSAGFNRTARIDAGKIETRQFNASLLANYRMTKRLSAQFQIIQPFQNTLPFFSHRIQLADLLTREVFMLAIKLQVEAILDALVKQILAIEDYFCAYSGIRLSEIYLFSQAVLWGAWFFIFNVENSSPVYKYIFSQMVWAVVFIGLAITHLIAFVRQMPKARARIVTAYALVWFVWIFIAGYAALGSTAAPTMFNQCVLSIAVAIHLGRKLEAVSAN